MVGEQGWVSVRHVAEHSKGRHACLRGDLRGVVRLVGVGRRSDINEDEPLEAKLASAEFADCKRGEVDRSQTVGGDQQDVEVEESGEGCAGEVGRVGR